jgi:Holliday junction resolvase RusA-like endonuclease
MLANHTTHRGIEFFVPGKPQPRGSKRAFPFKRKNGSLGVSVSDDNPNSAAWMDAVSAEAARQMAGREPMRGPVYLSIEFVMPRPKGHYGSGKNSGVLKASAPKYHTSKPDRLKLSRAVEDALTAIVYADDAQVVAGGVLKCYGEKPGVRVQVEALDQ